MSEKTKYADAEFMSRSKFIEWAEERFGDFEYDFEMSKDRYSCYDVILTTHWRDHKNVGREEEYLIEIKLRNQDYPTIMLEKEKYDKLVELGRFKDAKVLYLSFMPEGAFEYEFDGSEHFVWTFVDCNSHTVLGDGKKTKQITFLKKEDAHFINI